MDLALLKQRELELREKYPAMFSHVEARPNEIWLGDQLIDFIAVNFGQYRAEMPSARYSDKPVLKPVSVRSITPQGDESEVSQIKLDHRPVFADLREYIEAGYRHEEKKTQT